jgi:hypothetical protein
MAGNAAQGFVTTAAMLPGGSAFAPPGTNVVAPLLVYLLSLMYLMFLLLLLLLLLRWLFHHLGLL